jgi:hypothetical protein
MTKHFSHLLFILFIHLSACQRSASVSGVWREVDEPATETQIGSTLTPELYELNLGQYGDRVAGVSVRYQRPSEDSLALFDPADRCNCSFIVQGLIEELNDSDDRELLFVANGLTFSLYTPQVDDMTPGTAMMSSASSTNQKCPQLTHECKRIFNLEQVNSGERLQGFTWCLEAPDDI